MTRRRRTERTSLILSPSRSKSQSTSPCRRRHSSRKKLLGREKRYEDDGLFSNKVKVLPVGSTIPARVYKRWIFVSIVLTFIFSWLSLPYWFDTQIVPKNLGNFSGLFLENRLFQMLPNGFGDDFIRNMTSILQPLWQSEYDAQDSPGRVLRQKGAKAKYPVVLIPGVVTTGLEVWEGEACAQPYFRQRIWGTLTMMRLMLLDPACWIKHMKLNHKTGGDPDGIKLRPAQGLEAGDFLLPGFWVWARVIENLAQIGYDHNNLVMAPYDWRLDVVQLEGRDHFFTRLKTNIELLVQTRGEKVVAVSHSLGGLIWHYFLKWVESSTNDGFTKGGCGGKDWVERHIHASISVGTPYLGLPRALAVIVSGEMRDTVQLGKFESFLVEMLMSKKERLSLFRTWTGGFSMLPKGGNAFWGDGKPGSIVDASKDSAYGIINIKNPMAEEFGLRSSYLASDLDEFINDYMPPKMAERIRLAYSDNGISLPNQIPHNDDIPRTWTNPLQSRLPNAPSMKMYCFYGFGRQTERAYEYEIVTRDQWPEELRELDLDLLKDRFRSENVEEILLRMKIDSQAIDLEKDLSTGIYHVDGDGSVPTLSAGYMCAHAWKHYKSLNPGNIPVITREYRDQPSGGLGTIRGGPRGSEHVDILGNHEMTMDILKIVSGLADGGGEGEGDDNDDDDGTVDDRILSEIKEMASKIKVPFV